MGSLHGVHARLCIYIQSLTFENTHIKTQQSPWYLSTMGGPVGCHIDAKNLSKFSDVFVVFVQYSNGFVKSHAFFKKTLLNALVYPYFIRITH